MNVEASVQHSAHRETPAWSAEGVPILIVDLVLAIGVVVMFTHLRGEGPDVFLGTGLGLMLACLFLSAGLFSLQPNEAAVLALFGSYRGTVRKSGLRWANPFYRKNKISVRARNLNGDKLKVNDKRGNPIEIAAVVVWRVRDTAQATYDVESYTNYVMIQAESAVRHVASNYVYDSGVANAVASAMAGRSADAVARFAESGNSTGSGPDEVSLLGGGEIVSSALTVELQERMAKAGVSVEEARITHLAYAPEIAQAMLRRQQADAVIAARQKIVAGAVGMVQMALEELAAKQVVNLDEERKAAMVSNLLVVLCGESEAHPVINTGTLYH